MRASSPCVGFEVRPDGVALVTLAPARGELSKELLAELGHVVEQARTDRSTRASVIVSAEPQVFAQSDVQELWGLRSKAEGALLVHARHALAEGLARSTKPFVAAVRGSATGLGFELSLACDARIVANDAATSFALSDVRLGTTPSLRGAQRLAQIVGFERALDLAMSGRSVDAGEAVALGIAVEAVAPSSLVERAAKEALDLVRSGRPKRDWLLSHASHVEKTLVMKELAVRRAKHHLGAVLGRDAIAESKIVELYSILALRGKNASFEAEAEAFAELCVSSGARARMHLECAIASLRRELDAQGMTGPEAPERENARPDVYEVRPTGSEGGAMLLLEVQESETEARLSNLQSSGSNGRTNHPIIVVRKKFGGFSHRVLNRYLNEACHLLGEGAGIEHLDRSLVEWGFPIGPLALLDAIGLDVAKAMSQRLAEALGARFVGARELSLLVDDGRRGRENRRGFYHHVEDTASRLIPTRSWLGRATRPDDQADDSVYSVIGVEAPRSTRAVPVAREEVQMRCTLQLVNETLHCLGEGVLRSARDGDVATVVGLGFPAFRGGALHYVDAIGAREVLDRIEGYRSRFGDRFSPAPLLVDLADRGARIHG